MQDNASYTSFQVLAARAIYSTATPQQKIIDDPYAEFLLPRKFNHLRFTLKYLSRLPYLFEILKLASIFYSKVGISCIGLRHRYIDEYLQQAHRDGVKQVIILGAGFDSRAHRFRDLDIHFIEIDHPQTHKEKQAQLKKIHLPINDNVSYISVDFMQDWLQEIKSSGVVKQQKTLFIWEGVSYYLNKESVEYALGALRELVSEPSQLIFDALPKEIEVKNSSDKHIDHVQRSVADMGEPMFWGCDKSNIGDFLKAQNYQLDKALTLAEFALTLRAQAWQVESKAWQNYMYLVEAQAKK